MRRKVQQLSCVYLIRATMTATSTELARKTTFLSNKACAGCSHIGLLIYEDNALRKQLLQQQA